MLNLRLMRHPGNWVALALFAVFWATVYYVAVHHPAEKAQK